MLVSQVIYKNITAKTSAKCEMKESRSTKEIEKFQKKILIFKSDLFLFQFCTLKRNKD